MTDAGLTALFTAIPTTIASLTAAFIALMALRKGQDNGAKADVMIEKAVEIHTLTNSNLSKVTAALQIANEKILGMEKLMAQIIETKKETADAQEQLLTLARAAPPLVLAGASPVPVTVVNEPLVVSDQKK